MKTFSEVNNLLDFENLPPGEKAELLQNIVDEASSSVESLQVVMEAALKMGREGYFGVPATDLLWDIVNHPHVTPEMLDKIARYPHADVKIAVADRIAVLPKTMAYLAKSKDTEVLWVVVNNPSTPVESLQELAKRSDKLGLKARQMLFARHAITYPPEQVDYGKILRDLDWLPPRGEGLQ